MKAGVINIILRNHSLLITPLAVRLLHCYEYQVPFQRYDCTSHSSMNAYPMVLLYVNLTITEMMPLCCFGFFRYIYMSGTLLDWIELCEPYSSNFECVLLKQPILLFIMWTANIGQTNHRIDIFNQLGLLDLYFQC